MFIGGRLFHCLLAKNETSLLPVVVFIHGETFEMGTGNAYDGSVLAARGQIMVVTLNYRLGIFGRLSDSFQLNPLNQIGNEKKMSHRRL